MLPREVAQAAIDAGWAELHPVARMGLLPPTAVMLYAPRDEAELGVVEQLVQASHRFARPVWAVPRSELDLPPPPGGRPTALILITGVLVIGDVSAIVIRLVRERTPVA